MEENTPITLNAKVLEKEFEWFQKYVTERIAYQASGLFNYKNLQNAEPPTFKKEEKDSPYAQVVGHYGLGAPERIALILALAPTCKADLTRLPVYPR